MYRKMVEINRNESAKTENQEQWGIISLCAIEECERRLVMDNRG